MSLWAKAEEQRIASLAAHNAYRIVLERHKWRMERGDESLFEQKEAARIQVLTLDIEYNRAVQDAIKSGEPHPEDVHGC